MFHSVLNVSFPSIYWIISCKTVFTLSGISIVFQLIKISIYKFVSFPLVNSTLSNKIFNREQLNSIKIIGVMK